MEQGKRANITGKSLERFIRNELIENGYNEIEPKKFKVATYLEQPIFSKQYHIGDNIYGGDLKVDYILYHPEKHSNCLIIEAKWQQVGGSIDEKYPYFWLNIQEKYPCETILILDGGAYRKGGEQWLREKVGDKLIHVFNMAEFHKWVNDGGL